VTQLKLPSPAKINLFLHVVGRRKDGYHQLQTAFQFLDFSDQMVFTLRDDSKIKLLTPIVGVADDDNLIVRAAKLLQTHTGCKFGANIQIEKQIPMGAGLGGGSSNAATTLIALNNLWKININRFDLIKLGTQLGADVPIFLYGHAAWAKGIGEIFTPVQLPEPWYCVVIPPCHTSTQRIFSDPLLSRNTAPSTVENFLNSPQPLLYGQNDCQPISCKLYPEIAQALQWLEQFAPAKMTGTGSCVFASFSNYAKASSVLKQLPDRYQGFIAKGLNQSPTLLHLSERIAFDH